MKRFIPTLAAATLAIAASFAFAQGGPGYGPGPGGGGGPGYGAGPGMGGGYGPGAGRGAGGPGHEHMRAAYEACKGKPERQACMTEQFCSKSADPAKCQVQAKERQARMLQRQDETQAMHEACNGKRGEVLNTCLQDQRQARRTAFLEQRQKAHEACNGKRGDDLQKCLVEQRDQLRGPSGKKG